MKHLSIKTVVDTEGDQSVEISEGVGQVVLKVTFDESGGGDVLLDPADAVLLGRALVALGEYTRVTYRFPDTPKRESVTLDLNLHTLHPTKGGALRELLERCQKARKKSEESLAGWVKWEEELLDEISKEESCTSVPTS